MSCQLVTPWKGAPVVTSSSESFSVVFVSTVICFPFSVVWSSLLVMKDHAEVCPLSREGVPLSVPLQDSICFLCTPVPAISSACLTAAYRERKISGLPCFAKITRKG